MFESFPFCCFIPFKCLNVLAACNCHFPFACLNKTNKISHCLWMLRNDTLNAHKREEKYFKFFIVLWSGIISLLIPDGTCQHLAHQHGTTWTVNPAHWSWWYIRLCLLLGQGVYWPSVLVSSASLLMKACICCWKDSTMGWIWACMLVAMGLICSSRLVAKVFSCSWIWEVMGSSWLCRFLRG